MLFSNLGLSWNEGVRSRKFASRKLETREAASFAFEDGRNVGIVEQLVKFVIVSEFTRTRALLLALPK